jgi:hypothetical protein
MAYLRNTDNKCISATLVETYLTNVVLMSNENYFFIIVGLAQVFLSAVRGLPPRRSAPTSYVLLADSIGRRLMNRRDRGHPHFSKMVVTNRCYNDHKLRYFRKWPPTRFSLDQKLWLQEVGRLDENVSCRFERDARSFRSPSC